MRAADSVRFVRAGRKEPPAAFVGLHAPVVHPERTSGNGKSISFGKPVVGIRSLKRVDEPKQTRWDEHWH